jgi:hypothetical protein
MSLATQSVLVKKTRLTYGSVGESTLAGTGVSMAPLRRVKKTDYPARYGRLQVLDNFPAGSETLPP